MSRKAAELAVNNDAYRYETGRLETGEKEKGFWKFRSCHILISCSFVIIITVISAGVK